MPAKAKPIPEGYASVIPYLTVKDAAKAIDFYKKAFGATEEVRMGLPDGGVCHAELRIGDSKIMLGEECPEGGNAAPSKGTPPSVTIHLYVENVDASAEQAVAAGAKLKKPVENQFYGDRTGTLIDPFGHCWYVATHVEDVSDEETRRRLEACMKEGADKNRKASA